MICFNNSGWPSSTLQVEATYLRDDFVSRTNAVAENNRETRTKNETNLNEVKHQIHREKVPQDILSRIEGRLEKWLEHSAFPNRGRQTRAQVPH